MPRDHTGQEHRYLQAQTQLRAPMRVVMADGEEINGWIEYFDINFVRVTVHRGANRFIFKHDILYIQEESPPTRRRRAVQNY